MPAKLFLPETIQPVEIWTPHEFIMNSMKVETLTDYWHKPDSFDGYAALRSYLLRTAETVRDLIPLTNDPSKTTSDENGKVRRQSSKIYRASEATKARHGNCQSIAESASGILTASKVPHRVRYDTKTGHTLLVGRLLGRGIWTLDPYFLDPAAEYHPGNGNQGSEDVPLEVMANTTMTNSATFYNYDIPINLQELEDALGGDPNVAGFVEKQLALSRDKHAEKIVKHAPIRLSDDGLIQLPNRLRLGSEKRKYLIVAPPQITFSIIHAAATIYRENMCNTK